MLAINMLLSNLTVALPCAVTVTNSFQLKMYNLCDLL